MRFAVISCGLFWTAVALACCGAPAGVVDVKPVVASAPVIVRNVCLPAATYTLAQEQEVAKRLQPLGDSDVLVTFIRDYGAMRKANRAACGAAQ